MNSLEVDTYFGKRIYCYIANNNKLVHWVKRKYRKRERQLSKKQINEDLKL